MIATVKATSLHDAQITLPTSKSISNRLLLIRILCGTNFDIRNLSDSDDTAVMLAAMRSDLSLVDVGAAGTSMRFLTAYLATARGQHTITGSERMKCRPISILVDALRQLGAKIQYAEREGFPPLNIEGTDLAGRTLALQGNVSSQYISALMLIAPYIRGGLTLNLEGKIVSRPYISMTLNLMRHFGAEVTWTGNTIKIAPQTYTPHDFVVEADWSAASYWYAIAALCRGKRFALRGLSADSLQGDSAVSEIAKMYGVSTHFDADGIEIVADGSAQQQISYDFVEQPDLAQTFVVLSCLMGIPFKFNGLESLVIKETDRITALTDELRKLGYALTTNHIDTIEWHGECCTPSHEPILTYNDHRMAMAFAPAAIVCGPIRIDNPKVVSKSYPNYWNDLKISGFFVENKE
ncbi:MAG: 3-phosphoshikimate 1-carboxyvinyltransferase [Bacteroidales bacterium]|nr:3-phosphoshikimate 1-carboxyvinyltransferase [Bacteroidales bacterium]